MTKPFAMICGIAGLLVLATLPARSQREDDQSGKAVLRVEVNLVLLNVAVTDGKGHYVTGLRPSDFVVFEDAIPQKLATFSEGDAPQQAVDAAPEPSDPPARSQSVIAGANVFILFDTSNYMYRNFAV